MTIDKELYRRALILRDSLLDECRGMSYDIFICYVVLKAIEEIKNREKFNV